MTPLGRWHFLSNSINNKLILAKERILRDSFLHFYMFMEQFKQDCVIEQNNRPHFVAFPPLCVIVEVVYPLLGVPGQVPVPVSSVELTPELLPRCHAGPGI